MDFIKNKKYFFALSIILILCGIIAAFINGITMDIQFQGGTRVKIETTTDQIEPAPVEALIKETINKTAGIQFAKQYNSEKTDEDIVMMVINVASKDTLNDDEKTKLISALKENYADVIKENGNIEMISVEPFIGKELLQTGILAAFIASLLIVIYVAFRFSVMSGLSAALMAIVALLHDAAIMFSVYTVFQIPLNEIFIAAVLTILGYSMNDTIIIYDRIRENTGIMKKSTLPEIVNRSINQTLSRSINTVATSLICIVLIYVLATMNGIQSLREFSLPLIIGMLSGTYSSIFIASPLWMMWRESRLRRKVA